MKTIDFQRKTGVPSFTAIEYNQKQSDYVLLIPIINEGSRIIEELNIAKNNNVSEIVDIVICDGGSNDGSVDKLDKSYINSLLIMKDSGKQGSQLRMGMWWAQNRGYKGIITIDGNNKDSIEDVHLFVDKLNNGYDYVQGSRFVKGGEAINTPLSRLVAIKLIHAPIISITARHHFTDTTNNFRGYSSNYLFDSRVNIFRECFIGYELIAFLSTRASQLGYRVCEIPVKRRYPRKVKLPTKISPIKGNFNLIKILFNNLIGKYN